MLSCPHPKVVFRKMPREWTKDVENGQGRQEFQDYKLRQNFGFLVFKLSNDLKQVVVDHKGEPDSTLDDLIHSFPANEPRYAIIHVKYDLGQTEGKRSKLLFIMWCPSSATVKQKMMYAATTAGFRRALPGVQVFMQAANVDDLEFSEIMSKCERSTAA